jgi:cytochrome c-type biogenesis protein CcmH
MWLFWIVAGLLAAAAAALILARAAGAARSAADASEDPALPVYRRQLAELDDLAARGLLGDEERRAAFAEAGRRLLTVSERRYEPETAAGRGARLTVLTAVGAVTAAALGFYLALGSPGFPDQPYQARLQQWRTGDPSRLRPAEIAALLRELVKDRPGDLEARQYLGRAELAAGDPIAAATAFREASRLAPASAELQVMLGEALAAAGEGKRVPEAEAAFRRALELDPKSLPARYLLARSQIVGGDREVGLAAWRAIEADLPPDDPRRPALEADIATALGGARVAEIQAADAGQQAAFIQGMVAQLAQRLAQAPDDPEGWARLVRAYRVLGDAQSEQQALEKARRLFAGRPADLAKVEAEAKRGP